jgi:hypothetical protein
MVVGDRLRNGVRVSNEISRTGADIDHLSAHLGGGLNIVGQEKTSTLP